HYNSADEPRRCPPARRPPEFLLALPVLKFDAACSREVLSEKMRCSSLDRFAVLHHRFKSQCFHSAGKLFALRFRAGKNRNGEVISDKSFVQIQNQSRLRARFSLGFVNGVAFLPEKLGRAQK